MEEDKETSDKKEFDKEDLGKEEDFELEPDEEPEEEEEEKKEEPIELEDEPEESEKEPKKSKIWIASSFILFALLILSIFTHGFGITGKAVSELSENELIFLDSSACTTACDDMEPFIKEIAEKAGLEFRKATYAQPVEIPGYVLVYDNQLTIAGIESKAGFVNQVCTLTDSEAVCREVDAAAQEAEQESIKSAEQKCEALEKVDKPKLEIFYVSRCPFGVQAINSLYYVAKNFGDKVEVIPRLLVNKVGDDKTSSMHGEAEHIEDLRHICLREEQPEVYWDYIHCYVESGDSARCGITAKVDSDKLAACDGEKYAVKDADDWASIYMPLAIAERGQAGSPSLFLNGKSLDEYEFSQNGRSPENLKTIVCCTAKEDLSECENTLSNAQPPRGFGKIEQGSEEGTEGLNC